MINIKVSSNPLTHILKKHVSNECEPWDDIMGDRARIVRKHGGRKVPVETRDCIRKLIIEQLGASHARPQYITYERAVVGTYAWETEALFVAPTRLAIVAHRTGNSSVAVRTAFIPRKARDWQDTARIVLNRYCKCDGGYHVPAADTVYRPQNQDLDFGRRQVQDRMPTLHSHQTFGLDPFRVIKYPRLPAWPGAPIAETRVQLVRRPPANPHLRGGLD